MLNPASKEKSSHLKNHPIATPGHLPLDNLLDFVFNERKHFVRSLFDLNVN